MWRWVEPGGLILAVEKPDDDDDSLIDSPEIAMRLVSAGWWPVRDGWRHQRLTWPWPIRLAERLQRETDEGLMDPTHRILRGESTT